MPGMTGGDLVKGVIAAKENPDRRADAVVSVVVDRMIGLAALALLAMVVILLSGETFAALRLPILGVLGAGFVGAGLYAAKPLRRRLGLSWLVDRLPLGDKLRKLDSAALMYLRHPVEIVLAFVVSFANHTLVCVAVFAPGRALGVGEIGVAPVLDGSGTKHTLEWLRDYFEDPTALVPGTAHDGSLGPDFRQLSAQQRDLLAAFLFALKANPGSPSYPRPPIQAATEGQD